MKDAFYSPVISLGGQLTSMQREKPMGIFNVIGLNCAIAPISFGTFAGGRAMTTIRNW